MKKILLVALLSSHIATAQAEPVTAAAKTKGSGAAGDTYNFYFQKAPGPVTVNQGTTTAPAAPAGSSGATPAAAEEGAADPAAGTTASEAMETVAEDDGRSVRLNLSYVEIQDGTWARSGGGLGLTLSYFWSRKFGLNLGIAGASQVDKSESTTEQGDNWIRFGNKPTKHSRSDLALYATYYPLNVPTGSTSSLDVGLVGGGIYVRNKIEKEFGIFDFEAAPPEITQTGAIFFAGPSLAFNFGRHFGMLIDARFGTKNSRSYHAGIQAIF